MYFLLTIISHPVNSTPTVFSLSSLWVFLAFLCPQSCITAPYWVFFFSTDNNSNKEQRVKPKPGKWTQSADKHNLTKLHFMQHAKKNKQKLSEVRLEPERISCVSLTLPSTQTDKYWLVCNGGKVETPPRTCFIQLCVCVAGQKTWHKRPVFPEFTSASSREREG